MYIQTALQQIWTLCLLTAAGLAYWRGGQVEKRAATACLLASFLSPLAQNQRDWVSPQWAMFAVDAAFLAVLIWLAVTSRRIWPLFAAGFEMVGVVVHLAIVVDHQVRALTYHRGLVIFSYLVLIALAVGAVTTPQDERRPGKRSTRAR